MINPLNTVDAWALFFQERGIKDEYVSLYLNYIERLLNNGCPVIFELNHLSLLLGLNLRTLTKMIHKSESFYRTYSIPKRRGGMRSITTPYPSLLSAQKWIYTNILRKQVSHPCAHGFANGKSIVTNGSLHLNKRAFLKIDVENFFHSFKINWVIKYFRDLGYAHNISYYLAALCCYQGHLSQGSVTSPCLSNILFFGMDRRLEIVAKRYNLTYSRYADDIAFSGDFVNINFARHVERLISLYGFNLNHEKTQLHTKPGKRILCGLSISGEELRIPRKMKREIRKEVHYILKYGYYSHMLKTKNKNINYIDSLLGRINFWRYVEPTNENAHDYYHKVLNVKKNLQNKNILSFPK